jgi:dihydrofolate reductase
MTFKRLYIQWPWENPVRKLILQMQISVDGYVEAAGGGSWQIWDWGPRCTWDRELQRYFNEVYSEADCVLLSRNMAEGGFIDHWARIAASRLNDPAFDFARRVAVIEKVIATRGAFDPPWSRTRTMVGEWATTIPALKSENGGDILVFGGVTLASELLRLNLVDELQLFINPATVNDGRSIFGEGLSRYRLLGANAYECGIVVTRYSPAPSRSMSRSR